MELSENLKLRPDSPRVDTRADKSRVPDTGSTIVPAASEAGPGDEAESQMRKALGLLGESSRHRVDADRMEPPARLGDRFNGGVHRRRFVQDGDIPVTVLRRDQGHEAPVHRGAIAPATPTNSRLQRTEAALTAETASREKAERSLAETQSIVRDLQTKIGHAELAKNEAIDTLRRERDAIIQLRTACNGTEERLMDALERTRVAERALHACHEQLNDERNARKAAEKAMRMGQSARENAEQLVRGLSDEMPRPPPTEPRHLTSERKTRVIPEPEVAVAARGRRTPEAEPEPVKWWLNTKPTGKKR